MSEIIKKRLENYLSYLNNTSLKKLQTEWEEILEKTSDVEKELQNKLWYFNNGFIQLNSIPLIQVGMPVIIYDSLICHITSIDGDYIHYSSGIDQDGWSIEEIEKGFKSFSGSIYHQEASKKIKILELKIKNYFTNEIEYRMIDTKFWQSIITDKKIDQIVRYETNLVPYSKDWKRLKYTIEEDDQVIKTVNILSDKKLQKIDSKYSTEFNELSLFILGLNLIEDTGQCGKAESINPRGKRIIQFNRDGNYFSIKEDGGTRTVFAGVIDSLETLKFILNIVR